MTNKKLTTVTDASGMIWLIRKESLPRNKGQYIYWTAETMDKRLELKGDKKKDVINRITEKYGLMADRPKDVKSRKKRFTRVIDPIEHERILNMLTELVKWHKNHKGISFIEPELLTRAEALITSK